MKLPLKVLIAEADRNFMIFIVGITIAGFVVAITAAAWIYYETSRCEAKGGVLVKTGNPFSNNICVDKKAIIR